MPDRDGGVLRRARVGEAASCARPRRAADRATFVAAYRKGGKNDGNDAEAICEAVSRPSMRFVPLKPLEQQEQSL